METRLDLDQALALILRDTRSVSGSLLVDVPAALGRVLTDPVDAPISLPPFAASAMDGYALRSSDAKGSPPYRLKLGGTSFAGRPNDSPTPRGTCVRIFTGAAMPPDLDAVAIQEDCRIDEEHVWIDAPVSPGDNVRPPGHDVARGMRVLRAGSRLSAFDLGRLGGCGIARVRVYREPVVGIFSTGDELLDAGASQSGDRFHTPGPGQIFDANRLTLRALLSGLPVQVQDFGIVADDRAAIREVLEAANATSDVVITSGGVSVGEADRVKEVVSEIGTISVWRLNLKPGKPVAYGRLGKAAFFGLPGNPVSTIVTALMLARPAIERLCGSEPRAPLTVPAILRGKLRHQPGREEFQRGTLTEGDGELEVSVTGDQSSNRLASFAEANCLIRIPKECADLGEGSRVSALPFRGLL